MLAAAADFLRLARGLRAAVRYPCNLDPEAVLRAKLQTRETRFLELLQKIVFSGPGRVLRELFAEARCEYGGAAALVQNQGLESALETLRQAGVFVTHEEFKGRTAIVRGGRHIPADSGDFVNPLVHGVLLSRSSGSTGRPTSKSVSLQESAHRQMYQTIAGQQIGIADRRWISVAPILPAPFGLSRPIWAHKSGMRLDQWYSAPAKSPAYRIATKLLIAELRMMGIPMPQLSFLPKNDFSPVARDIADAKSRGQLSYVNGMVSSCVRVAAAAQEHGLDISGTRFWMSGEALTAAKAALVRRAGAEAYATYWFSEMGLIGLSCPHYEGENTVHHFTDSSALIAYKRKAPGTEAEVNSLLFTTLSDSAPFFVINLEPGDEAVLGPASCDCAFSRLGFQTVVSDISSYTKLTGHGTTLVGTDIVRILEESLPSRFGGHPGDYQLVEQEAGRETRIVIRVNPRLGIVATDPIREYFLAEVRKLFGGSLTSSIWTHASSVDVLLQAPIAGQTGKISPLYLLGARNSSKEKVQHVSP